MPLAPSSTRSEKKKGSSPPGKLVAEEREEKARQLIARLRSEAQNPTQGHPPHRQQLQSQPQSQSQGPSADGSPGSGPPSALAFAQEGVEGGFLSGTARGPRERQRRRGGPLGGAPLLATASPGAIRLSDCSGSPRDSPEVQRHRQPTQQLRRHLLDPTTGGTASPPLTPATGRPLSNAPGVGAGRATTPQGSGFLSPKPNARDGLQEPVQAQQSEGSPVGMRQGGERALNGSPEAFLNSMGGRGGPTPLQRDSFLLPSAACIAAGDLESPHDRSRVRKDAFSRLDDRHLDLQAGARARQGGERATQSMRHDLGAVRRAFGSSRERASDSPQGKGKEHWGCAPGPPDARDFQPPHLGPTHLDLHGLQAPGPSHGPVPAHAQAHAPWQAQAGYCNPSSAGLACGPSVFADQYHGRSRSEHVDPYAVSSAVQRFGPGAVQGQRYAPGEPGGEDADEDCLWGEDVGVVCVDENGCYMSPPESIEGEGEEGREREGEGEGVGSFQDDLWEQHNYRDQEQSALLHAPEKAPLPLQPNTLPHQSHHNTLPQHIQHDAGQPPDVQDALGPRGEPGPGKGQERGQGQEECGAGPCSALEKGRSGGSRDDMELKEHSQAYMDVTLLKELVRMDSRDDMALEVYRTLGEAATPEDMAQRLEMLKQEAIASSAQQRKREALCGNSTEAQGSLAPAPAPAPAPAQAQAQAQARKGEEKSRQASEAPVAGSGSPPQRLRRSREASDAMRAGGPVAVFDFSGPTTTQHLAGPGAGTGAGTATGAHPRRLQRSFEADDAPDVGAEPGPGRKVEPRRLGGGEQAKPQLGQGAPAPPQRLRRSWDEDDAPAKGAAAAAAAVAAAAGGFAGGGGGRASGKLLRSLQQDEVAGATARPAGGKQGRHGDHGAQRQGREGGAVRPQRPGEPREGPRGGLLRPAGAASGPLVSPNSTSSGSGSGREGGAERAGSSGLLRAESRDDIHLFIRHAPWDSRRGGEGEATGLERQRSRDDTEISYLQSRALGGPDPCADLRRPQAGIEAPHASGASGSGGGFGAGSGGGRVAVAGAAGSGACFDGPRNEGPRGPGGPGALTLSQDWQGHAGEWHVRKPATTAEGFTHGRPLALGQGQGQEEDYNGTGGRGRGKGGAGPSLSPMSTASGFWSEGGSSSFSSGSSSLSEQLSTPDATSLSLALPGARPLQAMRMSSAEESPQSTLPSAQLRRPRRTSLSGPVEGSPHRFTYASSPTSPDLSLPGSPTPGAPEHRPRDSTLGGGSQSPIPSPQSSPSAGMARRARRVSRSGPLGGAGGREEITMEVARRALQNGEAGALVLGRLPLSGLGPGPQGRQVRPQGSLGEELERGGRGSEGVGSGGVRRVGVRGEGGAAEEEDPRGGHGHGRSPAGSAPEEKEKERDEDAGSRVGFLEAKDGKRGLAQWGMAKIQKRMDQLLLKPNTTAVLGIGLRNVHEWYELGDVLGTGNFGTTRLAHSKLSKRTAACKSVPKTALKCKQDVEDVRREYSLLEMMRGLHQVPRLKDAFEDAEEIHFVMELCSGGDLFDRLKERRRYTEQSAARVLKTVLEVLDFCHERLIVHRDIKPENILLCSRDSDTDVKVIDFGIAAQLKPGGKPLTELMGSPMYIAPEVINGSYGCPADLWSTGVLLYVLLVGGPPFWAKTQPGILKAIKEARPNLDKPFLSEGAKDLISKLLTRDPARRITARAALEHPWLSSLVAE